MEGEGGYISTGTSGAIVYPLYIVAMDVSAGVGKFDTSQTKPLIAPLKESMILMMASLQTPSCIAAAHLSLIQNRDCVH